MPKYNKEAAEKVRSIHLKNKAWPAKEECKDVRQFPQSSKDFPMTYLPPENKGFTPNVFLTQAIDLDPGDQHPLPWYPPVCSTVLSIPEGEMFLDEITSIQDRSKMPTNLPEPNLKKVLLGLVNNGEVTEEEVGQRILTALQKNLGPRWLLFHLAGLYWRVVGNLPQSAHCLRIALHLAPADYVDVPLVNLANIVFKWDRLDDAILLVSQALVFADYEPVTLYTHANLLVAQRNMTGAADFYLRVLHLDHTFEEAYDMLLMLRCHLKYFHGSHTSFLKSTQLLENDPRCSVGESIGDRLGGGTFSGVTNNEISLGVVYKDGKFTAKEEVLVEEFYRQNNLCAGDECERLIFLPGSRPHVRFYKEGFKGEGHLVVFAKNVKELGITPSDCFLLHGGTRSKGCSLKKFDLKHNEMHRLEKVLLKVTELVSDQHLQFLTHSDLMMEAVGGPERPQADFSRVVYLVCLSNEVRAQDIHCFHLPFMVLKDDDVMQFFGGKKIIFSPSQLFSQIQTVNCPSLKDVNLAEFKTVWLGPNSVGVYVPDFLGYEPMLSKIQKPLCITDSGRTSVKIFDKVLAFDSTAKKSYKAEPHFKEVLHLLMNFPVNDLASAGRRIAGALSRNTSCWVSGSVAAFYWRTQGHLANAVACLKMSFISAPAKAKHIPLLNLANMLDSAGLLTEAVQAGNMALELAHKIPLLHFTLGNIHARAGDLDRAVLYYRSAIALQPKYREAIEKLNAVFCQT